MLVLLLPSYLLVELLELLQLLVQLFPYLCILFAHLVLG
jgi:hypothetical protein